MQNKGSFISEARDKGYLVMKEWQNTKTKLSSY